MITQSSIELLKTFQEVEKPDSDYLKFDFDFTAADLYHAKEMRAYFELEEKRLMQKLKDLCNHTSFVTETYAFICTNRKGSIDYNKIPELTSVDLEQYRKEDSSMWILKKLKE